MAAQHGNLLATAPLLKTVAAMVPQRVCIRPSEAIRINGVLMDRSLG
jgi:type IV secretory pathway protease TraF